MIERLLILDTETSGLDADAVCVEIAVALFDVTHGQALTSYASLIRGSENGAEAVNRIPVSLIKAAPYAESVWAIVSGFAAQAQAIVSFNAEFDRRFVPSWVAGALPWICAMDDIAWPRATGSRESLVKLALAHDLGVSHSHRAAVDVETLGRLLTRLRDMGLGLPAILTRALRPKAHFVVADKRFDAARNELAKAAGFRWDAPEARREWSRTMAIEDVGALPFLVTRFL